MTNNQVVKKNISSMQVIKTLQVLLEDNYTMTDLIAKLNKNEETPVFNNSVISKYINTCRYLGFEIPQILNKYYVVSMPFGMELTNRDLELFEKLKITCKDSLPAKYLKTFNAFSDKMNRYSNKNIARLERNNCNLLFNMFDKAMTEKRKIRLMLTAQSTITGIPIGIVENKGQTYLNILDEENDVEKLVYISNVNGIKILNEHYIQSFSGQVVVYKLMGELAERYTLRENEQLISKDKKSVTISNKGEVKKNLFDRLLRYESSCEILHPKYYREEMKNFLDDILKNYGE